MRLIDVCYTIVARMLMVIISILFAPLIFIIWCIPESTRWQNSFVYRVVCAFYWLVLRCALIPISYHGKEHLPTTPAIFVANHQSSLDIPLLGVLARGRPHIWLARAELLQTIILRHVLPIFAIVAEVTSLRAAMLSLRRIISTLADSPAHLMIFPEGSRSLYGNIQPFFDGFVIVAKKLSRPIIPVYIHNVNRVYPRGSFFLFWYPITVVVGPALLCFPDETEKAFSERVRSWFVLQQESMVKHT